MPTSEQTELPVETDPADNKLPATGTRTTGGTSPPTNCTDTLPHLCVDAWTPRSQLRRCAGELVAKERGTLLRQETAGTFDASVLLTVFFSTIDRRRYVSEIRWCAEMSGTGKILERRALFEQVYLPSSCRAVFACADWRSWLLSKLEEREQANHPVRNGTCREILCHLSFGLDSGARTLLVEFAQVLLTAALESGWCENDEQESHYDSQMKRLVDAIEKFNFKTPLWKT